MLRPAARIQPAVPVQPVLVFAQAGGDGGFGEVADPQIDALPCLEPAPAGHLQKRGAVVCDDGHVLHLRVDDVDPHIQGGGGHQHLSRKFLFADDVLPDVAALGFGVQISGGDTELLGKPPPPGLAVHEDHPLCPGLLRNER